MVAICLDLIESTHEMPWILMASTKQFINTNAWELS